MEDGISNSDGDRDTQLPQDEEGTLQNGGGESPNASSPGGHKRSLSGSILSKLSFLRTSSDVQEARSTNSQIDNAKEEPWKSRSSGGAMAAVLEQQKKTRKRNGSLRKTAMLGTGRLRLEGRDKRSSGLETIKTATTSRSDTSDKVLSPTGPTSPDELATPRQSYDKSSLYSASTSNDPGPSISGTKISNGNRSDEALPLTGLLRKQTSGDQSTTDEDEAIALPRSPILTNGASIMKKPSSSASDSYFPAGAVGIQRRRSANKSSLPLTSLAIEPATTPEEWDYSDTEWWGWVVLIVTWIVFVVGMGSCFGVWSWAWDVGETPYAPPELEDDPTLPIVGYYPALIILTAVMAWVWVTVAWVGMKYFKHAKISSEDV